MTILSLIVGILLVIFSVNGVLIIPGWLITLCFGIFGACVLFKIVMFMRLSAKSQINNTSKRF